MPTTSPREGMMAVVRNRRAMITGVQAFDADDTGRFHLVEVDYADGTGVESDTVLWEVEPGTDVLSPSALPQIATTPPMDPWEFDAMVRATRWAALTPSLPFSGLAEDRPPLAAPLYGAIHPEAYQLVPVLRALEMPRVALMLADAVGLGKTIQAGMVIRELMLRRRIRRVLVLCPALLRSQWRDEMAEKFALPFEVVDRPRTLKLQRELGLDANPWRTHERIITSYDYLKQPDVLEQFRTAGEPGEDGRLKWDLLIVDEAHNLAPAAFGADSEVSKMLQQIAPWFEHRLFLTATPHNGHTRSFSGLLEALDPVRFTRKIELDDEDRRRVSETVIRRLKSEINSCYTAMNEPARFSERHVAALPQLAFSPAERALHDALTTFRKALKDVSNDNSHEDRTAAAFAAEVLRKRLISGPWAFGQSWLSLMEGVTGDDDASAATVVRIRDTTASDTDDDSERESRQRHADKTVGSWLRKWKTALAEPIGHLTAAVEAVGVSHVPAELDPAARRVEVETRAAKVSADARLQALEALVDEHLRQNTTWRDDERIVIFSEYLATVEYLAARLRNAYGDGPWLLQMYGGMSDAERDAVKKAFNDPHGPARVLIATDAAGEGLNLQRAARRMLHWDIPWNPSRMEQRNGRLDRHGQKRDVFIYHFDSDDDAFLGFMGRVLRKRSQTREDRVVTDEIFSDAILAYFELEEDVEKVDTLLHDAIEKAKAANAEVVDDLPSAAPLPGAEDQARLENLKAELDLDPSTLRETLETAMAIETGRPRLQPDGGGRDRLVHPVPVLWQELIDNTLRQDGPTGPMLSLVFDPAHFIETHDGTPAGRPVYTPEPDAVLLHLGDMLYHRVMSTFARYRFPGGPAAATRWTVRTGSVPAGADALVLLTIEELAVNELREPCHHWVRTLAFPVRDGDLQPLLPHQPARGLSGPASGGNRNAARDIWDEVEGDLKQQVKTLAADLTAALARRMAEAGAAVRESEQKRFARRRRELEKAIADNQLTRLTKEAAKLRDKVQQLALFSEIDRDLQQRLTDLEAELSLRRSHYETVQARLRVEERRTLEDVLPLRYALRGDAQVYPISIEIRLPGGAT